MTPLFMHLELTIGGMCCNTNQKHGHKIQANNCQLICYCFCAIPEEVK